MTEQVIASRMMLTQFKQKTIAAKKGYDLLKKKCDALKTKFRTIMIQLLETKNKMGEEASDALFLIAKAQYAAGEFSSKVKDSVKRATIRIELSGENIAGVILPICHYRELDDSDKFIKDNNMNLIGIQYGGQTIMRCREKFKELTQNLIRIATLQTSFFTLDKVIQTTNRRVNALEHIVIPKFIGYQQYIIQELDEMAREDYYRLKKVLANKRRDTQIEEDQKQKLIDKGAYIQEAAGSMLEQQYDEEVVV